MMLFQPVVPCQASSARCLLTKSAIMFDLLSTKLGLFDSRSLFFSPSVLAVLMLTVVFLRCVSLPSHFSAVLGRGWHDLARAMQRRCESLQPRTKTWQTLPLHSFRCSHLSVTFSSSSVLHRVRWLPCSRHHGLRSNDVHTQMLNEKLVKIIGEG